jgi:hypothetical protein
MPGSVRALRRASRRMTQKARMLIARNVLMLNIWLARQATRTLV